MTRADLSAALALFVLPVLFDMGCAEPTGAPKLACWLMAAGLAWTISYVRPRISGPLVALSLWFAWSVLSSVHNGLATAWLHLLTVGAGLLWIAAGERRTWPWLALGWGTSVAYSCVQHLGLDPFAWNHPILSQERSIAGLGNPNYLSMYLAALMPLMWSRLYARGWWGWLLAFLSLITLIQTGTRGSLLALMAVLLMGTLASQLRPLHSRRFWVVSWGLFALSWVTVWQISSHIAFSMPEQIKRLGRGGDTSVSARFLLWGSAWQQGLQHPWLGVGPGHFGDFYLLHRPLEPESLRPLPRRPEDPHSEPSRVWSETGCVGFLLWSCWIGLGLRQRLRQPTAESACLLVLLLNGLTNCYPLALWPLLLLWTIPAQGGSQGVHWRGIPILLAGALAGLCSWSVQRSFWWDDEIVLRTNTENITLRELRLEWLTRVQVYCPPWYFDEWARRYSQAWLSLALLTKEPATAEQAARWARRRVQDDPKNAYAWSGLAGVLQGLGRWPDALKAWQQAQTLDPANPGVLFFLARAQQNCQDPLGALKSLERSLEIYSNSSQVYEFRAQIMIERGLTWEGYWDWIRSQQIRPGN